MSHAAAIDIRQWRETLAKRPASGRFMQGYAERMQADRERWEDWHRWVRSLLSVGFWVQGLIRMVPAEESILIYANARAISGLTDQFCELGSGLRVEHLNDDEFPFLAKVGLPRLARLLREHAARLVGEEELLVLEEAHFGIGGLYVPRAGLNYRACQLVAIARVLEHGAEVVDDWQETFG